MSKENPTIQEVFDTFTEEQKKVFYHMVGEALIEQEKRDKIRFTQVLRAVLVKHSKDKTSAGVIVNIERAKTLANLVFERM